MNEKKEDKWAIIEAIVTLELQMFQAVKVRPGEGASCQDQPDTFKVMRWMHHSVLPATTLSSYLQDLQVAVEMERNLVTEKYARMEGQIPQLKDNPRIYQIAEVECAWMNELRKRYPHTIRGDENSFRNYLICELETYSDPTLELLWQNVQEAQVRQLNLPELRYCNLFRRMGYRSLDEVEQKYSAQPGKEQV